MTLPIADSYWVVPGRFMAGEYPGARDDGPAARRIAALEGLGIRCFVNLTEAGEYGLNPYAPFLGADTRHVRLAIRDMGTPDVAHMRRILDTIDAALASGDGVYVHCYGGIGRTGTVVGCYLVRHGHTPADAVAQIAAWRTGTPDGWKTSPETPAQHRFIHGWQPGQ